MILRVINWTVMGIALFYVAEMTGAIEQGRYFPTLPRLEKTATDPMAWLGAAQWGVTQLGQVAQGQGAKFDTGSISQMRLGGETLSDRVFRQKGNTHRYLSGYYGS